MKYKAACPTCSTKVPLQQFLMRCIFPFVVTYRCKGCGATLLCSASLAFTLPALVIAILPILLYALHLASRTVVLSVVIVGSIAAFILIPFFARVIAPRQKPANTR